MAHADYNCCAICDEKQDYSDNSRTKEEICTDCLKAIRDNGMNIFDIDELIDWINSNEKDVVEKKLSEIGFSKCFYHNVVDDAYNNKLTNPLNLPIKGKSE